MVNNSAVYHLWKAAVLFAVSMYGGLEESAACQTEPKRVISRWRLGWIVGGFGSGALNARLGLLKDENWYSNRPEWHLEPTHVSLHAAKMI